MTRTGTFKYVVHKAVDQHHREGWMIVDVLKGYHGFFSVLMWRCDCFNKESKK